MTDISIIITAGGIGKRMSSVTPKQFLLLGGRPILIRTLEALNRMFPQAEFILSLPQAHLQQWHQLCRQFQVSIEHTTIDGGEERFHSVQNALQLASRDVVLIHDGVRPLVKKSWIEKGLSKLEKGIGVVPVVALRDSLREIKSGGSSHPVDRNALRAVQTPQIFYTDEIKAAYQQDYGTGFTDDASVFESAGGTILCAEGDVNNIKLTHPLDLDLAEVLLKSFDER